MLFLLNVVSGVMLNEYGLFKSVKAFLKSTPKSVSMSLLPIILSGEIVVLVVLSILSSSISTPYSEI